MSETQPPVTGHPDIDRALAGLDLASDVHTHPAAIADVLDAINEAINPTPQPPLPGR